MISDRLFIDLEGGIGAALDGSGNISSITGSRSSRPAGGWTQAVAGQRPSLTTVAGLGGMSCMTFTAASSTFLQAAVTPGIPAPYTIILSCRKANSTSQRLFESATGINGAIILMNGANVQYFDNAASITAAITTSQRPMVVTAMADAAGNGTLRVNATVFASGAVGTAGLQGTTTVLGSGAAGAPFYDGSLYGFRVWGRNLSIGEIHEEERRQARRCRIAIRTIA